ncbi:type IV pilin protein [Rhizobacter sp. OV335]|uniref:type IV pilin protein n=1 Tax=Rhizobacter sp. OV335 TaxID=1500264 RepID=UPI00091EE605|nr:prepilin-type N-terminal cleavage/methylation domain-containing protein [Rhizobacter sp. OV335]SHN21571.1 prepilin-type N-terminal cleavage/methylation domain-containing protein [Rhizobacter sp. OV335]
MTSTYTTSRGFTLVELSVVLAVALVTLAVALPGYSAQVQRSRAMPALMELSVASIQLEKFFQRKQQYGAGGKCAIPDAEVEHFSVHCSLSDDGRGYTLDAVGHGPMAGYQYRTDEKGRQQTISLPQTGNAANATLPCWSPDGRACGA